MPRLAAHERRERRGIILEFWTPSPPPLSPFLWRFGGNASPTHPPGHPDTAAAEPTPIAVVRSRMTRLLSARSVPNTQPLPKSKDHTVLVCVCIRMHATASLFLLPSLSPILRLDGRRAAPRLPPPHPPPSPAAQEVETSGANANETDLICAIICMTHIEEQGGRKEEAALGFGV